MGRQIRRTEIHRRRVRRMKRLRAQRKEQRANRTKPSQSQPQTG